MSSCSYNKHGHRVDHVGAERHIRHGCRKHPLYVLERHISRYEALQPQAQLAGQHRGEKYYLRSALQPLHTADRCSRFWSTVQVPTLRAQEMGANIQESGYAINATDSESEAGAARRVSLQCDSHSRMCCLLSLQPAILLFLFT